jgi:hypothetical protein
LLHNNQPNFRLKTIVSKAFLFFFISGLILSCAKEVDFDMVDDINVSPQGTLPLVNARLTLEDLASNADTLLTIDPDQALRLYYRQDSLFTFRVSDLVKIPDQPAKSAPLDRNTPFFQLASTLGTLGGAELDSVQFAQGVIDYALTSSAPLTDSILVRLQMVNSRTPGGTPFSADIWLPPSETEVTEVTTLEDVVFDLSNGGTRVNFVNLSLAVVNVSDLPTGVDLEVTYLLRDLEVQSAHGYFGQRTEVAPSGDFDFSLPGLEKFARGFILTDPRISLFVTSTAGLPVAVNSDFTGVNTANEGETLNPPDFKINAAPNVNQPVTSTFLVESGNSNIVDFLANLPNKIFYSGGAELNPDGRPAISNFVDLNSTVNVDFEANVPLELRLENMRFDEVFNDVQIGAEGNEEFIESISLFLLSENSLPFDMDLTVSFLDSVTMDSVGGFQINFLEAAPTDANGKVTAPRIFENEITLNQQQIDALLASNALRVQAGVSTANDGSKVAKLYATDGLNVRIAAKTKLNLSVNQL